MIKTAYIQVFFLLLTCFSINSLAELYLWTDTDGVKHFTTYAPPKEAANISVTSSRKNTKNKQYKQKVKTTNKVASSTSPASTANKKLTKAEEDEIDKEIQTLWKKHWKHLNKGDIDAALQSYTPSSKKTYRHILETLYGKKRK